MASKVHGCRVLVKIQSAPDDSFSARMFLVPRASATPSGTASKSLLHAPRSLPPDTACEDYLTNTENAEAGACSRGTASGCRNKAPQPGRLTQRTFILSPFWRLEVPDQGVGKAGLF